MRCASRISVQRGGSWADRSLVRVCVRVCVCVLLEPTFFPIKVRAFLPKNAERRKMAKLISHTRTATPVLKACT